MMNTILENRMIHQLVQGFRQSPQKMNRLQETDAEIICLAENSDFRVAATIDSIAEEITLGLYDDPYLSGWMIVMANLSDLAAVGAHPLGILVSEILPLDFPAAQQERLQQGIQDACTQCATYVLGGDTNIAGQLQLSGCALGLVSKKGNLSRIGCRPGDILFASNFLGSGNAFALNRFCGIKDDQLQYRPLARLAEGRLLCGLASACMDTSDGVLATLDQLMRLNNNGFQLNADWETAIAPEARRCAAGANIPDWLLLAGQHGEFELLFTVPSSAEADFLQQASRHNWQPLRLGSVIGKPAILLPLYGQLTVLDSGKIRNLAHTMNGDVEQYIAELIKFDPQNRVRSLPC